VGQIGRRVRARDALHAELDPPGALVSIAAHDAPDLAADERIESPFSLRLAQLQKDVRVNTAEGGGNYLATAFRDEAPAAGGPQYCKAAGWGGGWAWGAGKRSYGPGIVWCGQAKLSVKRLAGSDNRMGHLRFILVRHIKTQNVHSTSSKAPHQSRLNSSGLHQESP